jgi:hypothetical protein
MTKPVIQQSSDMVYNTPKHVGVSSRNDQHYALIVPLLYSIFHVAALESTTDRTTTLQHTGHVTTHYMIYLQSDLYLK